MTRKSGNTTPTSDNDNNRKKKKEHLNRLLDEGLEESFPASDPPAVVRPGHEIPTKKPDDKAD